MKERIVFFVFHVAAMLALFTALNLPNRNIGFNVAVLSMLALVVTTFAQPLGRLRSRRLRVPR